MLYKRSHRSGQPFCRTIFVVLDNNDWYYVDVDEADELLYKFWHTLEDV